MKYIIIFLFIIASNVLYAQPFVQWQRCYGGTQNDAPGGLIETSDGGYIMAGQTQSIDGDVKFNHGNKDLWVVKFNAKDSIEWQRTYGGSQEDDAGGILPTSDGGYIIATTTYSIDGDLKGLKTDSTQADIWVLKIDSNGNIKWQKTFGGSKDEYALSLVPGSEGKYLISALTNSTDGDVHGFHGGAGFDTWLFEVSEGGVLGWQKTLGGTKDDEEYALIQTRDAGYAVAGYTMSVDGDITGRVRDTTGEVWVVKLNSVGDIQWQKTYGGSKFEEAYAIIQTLDHGYAIAGITNSNDGDVSALHQSSSASFSDCWVIKLDSTGTIEWQKTYGGSQGDQATSIIQTPDSGYVVAGSTSSDDGDVKGFHGQSDCWVFAINPTGQMITQKTFGGSWTDANIGAGIMQTKDNGFLVATVASSYDGDVIGHHGDSTKSDIWLIKLSPLKNGVKNISKIFGDGVTIFPNPSLGKGTVSYALTNSSQTKIEIFNPLGEKLRTIINTKEEAGSHDHSFDISNLPSGSYFLRTEIEGKMVVRTIELLH